MKHSFLCGTGVALVTPFHDDFSIDYEALAKLVNYVIEGGVEYLVVMGTTGESVVLDPAEKSAILSKVQEVNAQRIPVVLGIGGNNTTAVVSQIKSQDFSGISALLSVCPYYNKPNQKGLYAHFAEVAKASPVPVILYNVPGRTGSSLAPETALKLATDFNNVVAVKEASGQFDSIMKIVAGKPDDFVVISGDDGITLPLQAIGVEGVISVIGNALPFHMSELVRLGNRNEFEAARKYHYDMLPLFSDLFVEGNPAGVKAALHSKGVTGTQVRLPLTPVSEDLYGRISSVMKRLT